jgi:formamidopyrimidine-DNA glycosylase
MPELPDVLLYRARIEERIVGQPVQELWVRSISVLKTFEPKPMEFTNRSCAGVGRIGKRIVLQFEGEFSAVIHPMIAGRFAWDDAKKPKPRDREPQFGIDFPNGRLMLKEFGHKKRSQLHLFRDLKSLETLRRGGLDVFTASPADFESRLKAENRTVKRRLTDPDAFDGIGNAYSDEILWQAGISPVKLTSSQDSVACARLLESARSTLSRWIDELDRSIPGFPSPRQVTAFRPDFGVHGRAGLPCPRCGHTVQKIVFAENECNYCAVCQNGVVVLADQSLSRLLKDDWPRSIEDWEQKFSG